MSGLLPIAEQYDSLQGEGQWVGTPMRFIRLAGCNVGRPAAAVKEPFPLLPTGRAASACATWDGRHFWCDTDYSKKGESSVRDLFTRVWQKHICLTGGEPFLHQQHFDEMYSLAQERGIRIHVESSGTIMPTSWPHFWVTCAPKISAVSEFIKQADEVKVLVDAGLNADDLTPAIRDHHNVFLCPVNGITQVDQINVALCMALLHQFPHWRLSWQAHKDWGLR